MRITKTAPSIARKAVARTTAVPLERPDAEMQSGEKTLAERALRLLRDDILNGTLAPEMRLRINVLQQAYGLGLSPLREALLRLLSEGLVVAEGQRGFMVAPVSLAELQDLTRARTCLDISALAQAMLTGDADWESRVMAANHLLSRTPLPIDTQDVEAARLWEERHRAFHLALVSGSGSSWLMRLHSQLTDHVERYRTIRILHHRERESQVRDVAAEHTAITEAVLRRDVAQASELMTQHIANTAVAMAQIFEPKPKPRPNGRGKAA